MITEENRNWVKVFIKPQRKNQGLRCYFNENDSIPMREPLISVWHYRYIKGQA